MQCKLCGKHDGEHTKTMGREMLVKIADGAKACNVCLGKRKARSMSLAGQPIDIEKIMPPAINPVVGSKPGSQANAKDKTA